MRTSSTARCRPRAWLGIAALAFALTGVRPLAGQDEGISIRVLPGLGVEYFSRTLAWDADTSTSPLKASLASARVEMTVTNAARLGVFGGYGDSNFNGLVFRGLPFSVDYEAGSTGSFFAGADLDAGLFPLGDFKIGVTVQYLWVFPHETNHALPSLNQTGTVEAKATWRRIIAGPIIRYMGYESFVPFVALTYDHLWGTFTLSETVQDLSGTEEKQIQGKGSVGISLGTAFEPTPAFRLNFELNALPLLEGFLERFRKSEIDDAREIQARPFHVHRPLGDIQEVNAPIAQPPVGIVIEISEG
jgi:hypothetical protein